MKKIGKYWIPISIVMLMLMSVGIASAETYVITGGGAIVTVNAPSIDMSSAGALSKAFGDITVAKTDITISGDTASSFGSASAETEDGPAASATVSWVNSQGTSAGYAYALSIGIPEESGDVVLTDVSVNVDRSVSGFFIDAEGSAEIVS